jgi:hypothetical protein
MNVLKFVDCICVVELYKTSLFGRSADILGSRKTVTSVLFFAPALQT